MMFVLIGWGAVVALGVCGIIVLAVTGSSLLTFNDKWGSYRGYIWRKIVEVYGDAPFVNKLFGYGNESVRVTLKAACYNEMVQVTGKVYDNAHNELLQYLFIWHWSEAVSSICLSMQRSMHGSVCVWQRQLDISRRAS